MFPSIRSFSELPWTTLTDRSLVVMDVDNVLIHSKDPVLRPLSEEIENHPLRKVYALPSSGRSRLFSLLWSQSAIELTDPRIPEYLNMMRVQNVAFMALTALPTPSYGVIPDSITARLTELQAIGIDLDHSRWPSSPVILNEDFPSDYPCFKKGVLFSQPYSKGSVLDAFLRVVSMQPDVIWMIDDIETNLCSVKRRFPNAHCFYYQGSFISPTQVPWDAAHAQVDTLIQTEEWTPLP